MSKRLTIHKDIMSAIERYCPMNQGWIFQSTKYSSHFKVFAPDGVFCGMMCGGLNSDRSLRNATGYMKNWRNEYLKRRSS